MTEDWSLPELVVGSWREALAADGLERIVLVGLVATMTVVMPILFIAMVLAWFGLL